MWTTSSTRTCHRRSNLESLSKTETITRIDGWVLLWFVLLLTPKLLHSKHMLLALILQTKFSSCMSLMQSGSALIWTTGHLLMSRWIGKMQFAEKSNTCSLQGDTLYIKSFFVLFSSSRNKSSSYQANDLLGDLRKENYDSSPYVKKWSELFFQYLMWCKSVLGDKKLEIKFPGTKRLHIFGGSQLAVNQYIVV